LVKHKRREWGEWLVLESYPSCKIKELKVLPGKSLSWQSHEKRNELWFIREGTATIYYSADDDGKDVFVTTKAPNDTFMINKRKWHQLANETEESVSVIEIQYGDECVEHDILRAVRPTRGVLSGG
jgi:mannose-6-phosphate isomerase